MRTAMIVDDEILSVRMLSHIIDWNAYGVTICATAEDGIDALAKCRECHPDIILTDIRMPRMDGLEFIRTVKAESPETEFILISAYADFSYVKKAMELGCTNYLLKPVDERELEETLKTITHKIDVKILEEHRVRENRELMARQDLNRFMRTGSGWNRLEENPCMHGGAFGDYRLCSILPVDNSINDYVENSSLLEGGLETVEKELADFLKERYGGLLLGYEEDCFVWLLMDGGEFPVEWSGEIRRYFQETFHMEVHICFTMVHDDLKKLPMVFERLKRLRKFSFYIGDTPVLGYGYNCEEAAFDQLDLLERTKLAAAAVQARDVQKAGEIVREVLEESVNQSPSFLPLVYEFCYQVVCAVREQLSPEEQGKPENTPLVKTSYQEVAEIPTAEGLEHFMEGALRVLGGEAGGKKPRYGRLVQEGCAYLEEHFDSNISLDEMCGKLAVSKNYFCYLFKRETGESVWSYLTEIRLKRSKELLLTTDYKSYEIAYMVGYDNPSYFSRLFKKSTGMTPNGYRNREGKKGEETG